MKRLTLDAVMQREEEIREFLRELKEKNGYEFVLLLVTDIIAEGSNFLVEGDHKKIDKVFGIDSSAAVWMPGVLSRKKQVAAPLWRRNLSKSVLSGTASCAL